MKGWVGCDHTELTQLQPTPATDVGEARALTDGRTCYVDTRHARALSLAVLWACRGVNRPKGSAAAKALTCRMTCFSLSLVGH